MRVTGVSARGLQYYVNAKYEHIPKKVSVEPQNPGPLTIECAEMWSFVQNKGQKQWIGLALAVDSRASVGVYVGSRDKPGARGWWAALPAVYRQCAVAYTDCWSAYAAIFPATRHRPRGKASGKTGQTNHIERFNGTLRQRRSRLVRKTLSFSKKLENHIGAIGYFVHHYNATLV